MCNICMYLPLALNCLPLSLNSLCLHAHQFLLVKWKVSPLLVDPFVLLSFDLTLKTVLF